MNPTGTLRQAIRTALAAGTSLGLASASLLSQAQTTTDPEEESAKLDKVVVTGSRIKRLDIESASPITVITRDDIDASGDVSVADILRGTIYNSFGSFKERSGNIAQSQAFVDLRGLGPQRTLVLLNGRRVSNSPTGMDFGQVQNLNVVPLAAVERIEILRDSASAIYGSDAIGGVINIILRKNFEGINISVNAAQPDQKGGDETAAAIVGGVSSLRGDLVFTLDHYERDIVFAADRDFTRLGLSSFGFPGSFFAFDPDTGDQVGVFPDARCPVTQDGLPPETGAFPNSVVDPFGQEGICLYNFNSVAAKEASIKRDSLFVDGEFRVSDDSEFFVRATVSRADSFGRFAPAPMVGGFPFLPTMGFDNPNNPSVGQEVDFDGDGTPEYIGPFDLDVIYRNVPGGSRIGLSEDLFFDATVGFRGALHWLGGMEWEVAAQHSRQISQSDDLGFSSRTELQRRIDDGSFDVFGVNGPTDPAIARSIQVDGFSNFETTFSGFDATLSFDAVQMNSGAVPMVFGFEYRDETYQRDFDEQQNQGSIDGSVRGPDVAGTRALYSIFGESRVPITQNMELGLALRFDHYSDFGDTVNPKITLGWQPTNQVLLRSTWATGFRAPSLDDLFFPQELGGGGLVDTLRCNESGQADVDPDTLPASHPCVVDIRIRTLVGGNSDLDPEESISWTVGIVWNPVPDLSMALDYYNLDFDNEISELGGQAIIDAEALSGSSPNVVRDPNTGRISQVNAIIANLDGVDTQGLEFDIDYTFRPRNIGEFTLSASVAHKLEHNLVIGDGGPRVDALKNQFLNDTRATASLAWFNGDFSASVTADYISEVPCPGTEFPVCVEGVDPFDPSKNKLGSSTVTHVHFSYALPWNAEIAVGAKNVFNRDPPRRSNGNYSNTLHDIYGRVPYLRYTQDL